MKKLLLIGCLMLFHLVLFAQNRDVEQRLKSKYSLVQYHRECGGWYFLSYSRSGQQLYGFADNKGNVVAQDADKYRIHPGYIELCQQDKKQAALHDQWKNDMTAYERDYKEYLKVEKAYEAELAGYKAKVKLAEEEANVKYQKAKEKAKAQVDTRQLQNATSEALGGGIWGALAGLGASAIAKSASAAVSIPPYESFLAEVLAERGLSVEPAKPYNPMPTKPVEPPTGAFWKSYSLRQPVRYDFIDFGSISELGNFADVSRNGKWGLVDSEMKEVIPCVNAEKVLVEKYPDNKFLVRRDGKYGVIDGDKKFVVPCIYDDMTRQHGYWLCSDDAQLWGVYTADHEELYPCQFQDVNLVQNGGKLMLYNKNKGLWGVIDFLTGNELMPNLYSAVEFSDYGSAGAFYKVCSDSRYGLYSDAGVVVIPCSYTDINIKDVAGRKMIEVHDGKNIGLYESTGIEVLPAGKYISYNYDNQYYKVLGTDGKVGLCDVYGKELLPCRYTALEHISKINAFIASDGGRKGIVSMTGKELFPFVHANILELYPLSPDVLVVGTGDLKGFGAIDYEGNIVVPMKNKYDKLKKKIDAATKKYPLAKVAVTQKKKLEDDASLQSLQETREFVERKKFSFFAQNYVERVIGEWQKKGEFEKVEDWRKRVNKNTLDQRVYSLTKEAQTAYIEQYKNTMPQDTPKIVGTYDPDNETYRISTKFSDEDILVKVDSKDALEFKASFGTLGKNPVFFVENDGIGLAEYVFTMPDGKKYRYSNQASLTYSIADVQYNIGHIEIDKNAVGGINNKGKQTISTSTITFGRSDVDVNIPISQNTRPNTFAVIIANENYDNERRVDYAYNDGQAFSEYCQKSLGIPKENIHFRPDATLNHIKFEVGWLRTVTKAYPNAKILFYYAGHGVPDAYTRESYLLPVDGYGSDIDMTGYKLSELYSALGELPADNVLVMLDACFSGSDRTGQAMSNVRAVKVTPKKGRPSGNVVVFSATSGQQVAHPYMDQSHGLFTYFLLKKLQETHGEVNYGEWFDYVKTNVAQKASVVNNIEQTPTVVSAPAIVNTWKSMAL